MHIFYFLHCLFCKRCWYVCERLDFIGQPINQSGLVMDYWINMKYWIWILRLCLCYVTSLSFHPPCFQIPQWVVTTSSGCRSTAATTRPEDQRNPSRRLVSKKRFTPSGRGLEHRVHGAMTWSAALCYAKHVAALLSSKENNSAERERERERERALKPRCVGSARGKSLAFVLNIMSQSCGVLANKTHLLKKNVSRNRGPVMSSSP